MKVITVICLIMAACGVPAPVVYKNDKVVCVNSPIVVGVLYSVRHLECFWYGANGILIHVWDRWSDEAQNR